MSYADERHREPSERERYLLLAFIVALLLVALTDLIFLGFFVAPRWIRLRRRENELTEAQQQLEEILNAPTPSAAELQTEIVTAQARLTEIGSTFFSSDQADHLIDHIYTAAANAGVSVTRLQDLPTPQESADVYDIRAFRLEARGSVPRLLDFLQRLELTANPGLLLTDVNIDNGNATALLRTDVFIYTSPYGEGTAPFPGPSPTTQPPDTRTQLEMALVQAQAEGNWPEAINLLQQLRALEPENPTWEEELYVAHLNYGYDLRDQGRLEQAREQFNLALLVNPEGAEAIAALQALQPPPTPSGYEIYIVQRGDTLFSIARRYNVSVEAIIEANDLTGYTISIGQELRIPR
ncbi:MAG: LysM peptidoglycan-binding domain-containing protein [Anaerolineae bacterium]